MVRRVHSRRGAGETRHYRAFISIASIVVPLVAVGAVVDRRRVGRTTLNVIMLVRLRRHWVAYLGARGRSGLVLLVLTPEERHPGRLALLRLNRVTAD